MVVSRSECAQRSHHHLRKTSTSSTTGTTFIASLGTNENAPTVCTPRLKVISTGSPRFNTQNAKSPSVPILEYVSNGFELSVGSRASLRYVNGTPATMFRRGFPEGSVTRPITHATFAKGSLPTMDFGSCRH